MDILDFLKERPFKNFVVTLTRKERYPSWLKPYMFFIQNRILTIHGFFKGYFTLKEAVILFVTYGRFKSESLQVKFSRYTINEITSSAKKHIEKFIYADGSVNVRGNKFYPAKGNYGELIDLLYQIFIIDQYEAKEFLCDGFVVIDAGANIGSFSVFAATLKNNVTVHAFEPVKGTFEALKKNTSPYSNIFCHNAGLGDSVGHKKIFFSKDATVGSAFEDTNGSTRPMSPSDELSEEAQIKTIDSFVKENNIQRIDYIKIDTEGYEANILKGAIDTIKKFQPVITMSAYHKEEDAKILPQMIMSMRSDYQYRLVQGDEADLIFYPKK